MLTRLLSAERKPKEIGELDFGAVPGRGRLPWLYFLTKLGADLLASARKDLDEVPYVMRATKFNNDYWHRVYTVDFHIALRAFADRQHHRVKNFKTYFEYARQNESVTRIPLKSGFIVSDAISMLDCADGHERLLVFEMANGSDAGQIEKQIDRYVEAFEEEAIEVAVGVKGDDSCRVLFVFEHVRTFENLKKRLADDLQFQEWSDKFFCKPREWLETEPFRASWLRLAKDGAPTFLSGD